MKQGVVVSEISS